MGIPYRIYQSLVSLILMAIAPFIIEIDTRSFAEDPEQVPFLTNSAFKQLSDSNKTDLILQAKSMIENALQLRFGNNDWYLPEFIFDFVEQDRGRFEVRRTFWFYKASMIFLSIITLVFIK